MQRAALALAVVVALAGCFAGPSGQTTPDGTDTSSPPPAPDFDGNAALDFVKGLALRPDGEPRFRMPGTAGQTEGAAYLWQQMAVPGWTRAWQNFTGADYLALDLSEVKSWGPNSAFCPAADREALPAWPFHNLYAIRPGTAHGTDASRLLLLGAHWDSQMNSQADNNESRQDWPDPGANDGASGVGLLLQLMRELDGMSLAFDVGVIFLDGEDGFFDCYPLAGSLFFAQHPPVATHRFILLDMVGDADARYIREYESVASDAGMVDLIWAKGHARGGQTHFTETIRPISDDHLAFIQQGIPSVDVIDAGRGTVFPPRWDTTEDTVDHLAPTMLGLVGATLLDVLADPELSGPWPPVRPPTLA